MILTTLPCAPRWPPPLGIAACRATRTTWMIFSSRCAHITMWSSGSIVGLEKNSTWTRSRRDRVRFKKARGGANHKNRAGTLPLSSSASRAYHRGFLRRRSPFGPNRAASGGSSTKATGFIVVVFADVEPHRNDFPRAVSIDENQHEQRGTDESNQDGRRLSRAGARGLGFV